MFYIIEKGTNQHVIFLLHGTGGDAKSMLDLGKRHDPEATLISLEGTVNENGMNRYFARFPNGSFDVDRLSEDATELFRNNKERTKEVTRVGRRGGAIASHAQVKTPSNLGVLLPVEIYVDNVGKRRWINN